jgi:ribose transport system permease protein
VPKPDAPAPAVPAPDAPAPVAALPGGWRGWARYLASQHAPLLLAHLILLATLSLYALLYLRTVGIFPSTFDWTSVLNTGLPLALAATGQSIVMLTRGLDLSVGGVIACSISLAATRMGDAPAGMLGWSAAILLLGAAAGVVNGALVAYVRLQPILVTIATLSVFSGVAIWILPQPGGSVPAAFTTLLANPNLPTSVMWLALLVAGWFAFRRTTLGTGVYAVGNDEEAARALGVPVTRVKVLAYTASGMLAAAAGLFEVARRTAGDATAGEPFVLTSIAAVILGGVSFFGGRGSAVGSISGAFALTLVVPVLFFARIDQLYQAFYQGLFLILVVVLGTVVGRLARRRAI